MRTLRLLLAAGLIGAAAGAVELCYNDKPVPKPPPVLARGCANLALGWVELPRCIVYEGIKLPVIGAVWGSIKGSGLIVARTLGGGMDILSLGFSGCSIYNSELPFFPWQAPWVPEAAPSS